MEPQRDFGTRAAGEAAGAGRSGPAREGGAAASLRGESASWSHSRACCGPLLHASTRVLPLAARSQDQRPWEAPQVLLTCGKIALGSTAYSPIYLPYSFLEEKYLRGKERHENSVFAFHWVFL